MKLLSKTDINSQKALERKAEIEEGAKLAKKVDTLRQKAAEVDVTYDAYRKGTVAATLDAVATASLELDRVLAEVATAKEERKGLREPLDAEWKQVKSRENAVTIMETTLQTTEANLSKREDVLTQREDAVSLSEGRANAAEKLAQEHLKAAEDEYAVSRETHARVDEEMSIVGGSLTNRERVVGDREERVTMQEAALALRRKAAEDKETANAQEERRLQDLAETLIRSQENPHG